MASPTARFNGLGNVLDVDISDVFLPETLSGCRWFAERDRQSLDEILLSFNSFPSIDYEPTVNATIDYARDIARTSPIPLLPALSASSADAHVQSSSNSVNSRPINDVAGATTDSNSRFSSASLSSRSLRYHKQCDSLSSSVKPEAMFPPAAPVPARGRGRPKKVMLHLANSGKGTTTKRTVIRARRNLHNDSAKRSRNKFNTAIEEPWKQVPESERLGYDGKRVIPRTEKLQITISYIRRLQVGELSEI